MLRDALQTGSRQLEILLVLPQMPLSLARALAAQSRWPEAEQITQPVRDEATSKPGKGHPLTVSAIDYLNKLAAAKAKSPAPREITAAPK